MDALLPEVVDQLRSFGAVVLTAPPGAGKTTRVPPALLAAGLDGAGTIVLLQPRRLAARAVARKMARDMGQVVGQTVGYRVRFDNRSSAQTRILVVTEGILTRQLLADPLLEGVGCVILDEFHERSVHSDLALAFLREVMEARDDLRVVVMSATLAAEPVARFLGGCPVVSAEAREHPLQIDYLTRPGRGPIAPRVRSGLLRLLGAEDDGGDLLAFLPGAGEIRRAMELLRQKPLPGDLELVPLFGALPAAEQDRALSAGPRRRVVLSTNIAETSLTVPGVTAVLDVGLVKQLWFDRATGLDRLELRHVSHSSADQRAGRAGRLAPGRALRMWTAAEQAALAPDDVPELRRLDLAPVLLSVMLFSPGDPRRFAFFEAPETGALEAALELLRMLGAAAARGFALTAMGKRLASMPVHPRVGAVLDFARRQGLAADGAMLAALLAERDPLIPGPAPDVESDLLYRHELCCELSRGPLSASRARRLGLDLRASRQLLAARDQLLRITGRGSGRATGTAATEPQLRQLPLAGYPDRLCRRRHPGKPEALMVGGRGVRLSPTSGVRQAPLFLALQADAGKRGLHSVSDVRLASAVDEQDLRRLFAQQLSQDIEPIFHRASRSVRGMQRCLFADLVISEHSGVELDPQRAAELLHQAAASHFDEVFRPDRDARQLLARLTFAATHLPREAWIDVSTEGLQSKLLAEVCVGRRSFQELARVDWAAELMARLSHRQRRLLQREVPATIQVPSGRSAAIDYEEFVRGAEAPVLAVKLQELFGLAETPRIARGQVPLLVHLLAPNGRPAQVTRDLRSFWNEGYALVRRDLRGRYPKHPWPEDPWTAKATARTTRYGNKRR